MVIFHKLKKLSDKKFLRMVGLQRQCFSTLIEKIKIEIEQQQIGKPIMNRGIKGTFLLEDKILVTLYYLRHYPTLEILGGIFSISTSYAHKIYKKYSSIMVKLFHVEGAKSLTSETLTTVLIDVTEQEIERPTKGQKQYYSGKQKRHTIKAQLIICAATLLILCVVCAKGHVHDFTIFKESDLIIGKHIEVCVDLGYQGIKKLLENVSIPDKKPKGGALTAEQKAENKVKSKKRIPVEHINRKCKIFRIVKETFRGKHKNMAKTWNLIAGLVNFRYAASTVVI